MRLASQEHEAPSLAMEDSGLGDFCGHYTEEGEVQHVLSVQRSNINAYQAVLLTQEISLCYFSGCIVFIFVS